MNSSDPIPAVQLEYRTMISPDLAPAFRAISILVILLGALNIVVTVVRFFPYFTNQIQFPAYYPRPGIELLLNIIPNGFELFGIVAASIVLSTGGGLRTLIVWAWCKIVVSICATAFNLVFELVNANAMSTGRSGNLLPLETANLIYRLIASLTLPIILIVLARLSDPREFGAVMPKR
jgi:hypothetical protein